MKKLIIILIVILAAPLFSGQSLAGETMMGKETSGMMGSSGHTAEQLIGLTVNNSKGEHVGQIRNVNQNPKTGEIYYVILGSSLLGIGETKHAVPLEALKIQTDEKRATLIVPQGKLENAPNIAAGESAEEFKVLLQKHYGVAPASGEGMGDPRSMMK